MNNAKSIRFFVLHVMTLHAK